MTHTVNQSTLPKAALLETEVPVPPLAEQRRIVAKLETLLGKVDACRARLAKISILLKRFRQSVLAAACSGRLTADWRETDPAQHAAILIEAVRTRRPAKYQDASVREDLDLPEVPDNWVWTNLRFLLSPEEAFCYGVVQPGEDDPDGAFLVRAGDLDGNRVDMRALRRIPITVHEAYQRSQLRGGEVLVTVVGAGIGKTAIAQDECVGLNIARAVAKLPIREFGARYVQLWLSTTCAVAWMKADSREVARPTLNLEQLQTLPVPVPPLPEQHEIVRRVDALFALADQIEARVARAQSQVDKLTPSLLARAFRGELVPQDPNDEPASVLLRRIRRGVGSEPEFIEFESPSSQMRALSLLWELDRVRLADVQASVPPFGSQCTLRERAGARVQPEPLRAWLIGMTTEFRKAIRGIDRNLQGRVLEAIEQISQDPMTARGDTVKPLSGGLKHLWRYRIGDFRLVYRPDSSRRQITLSAFGARGGVYD